MVGPTGGSLYDSECIFLVGLQVMFPSLEISGKNKSHALVYYVRMVCPSIQRPEHL